jgi:hypothetical protein
MLVIFGKGLYSSSNVIKTKTTHQINALLTDSIMRNPQPS